MSKFPHDEFVKEFLPELYQDYGKVIPSADVSSQRRQIDVLFIPDKPVPTTPETLGLLGKMAQTTSLFEVYRNPVTPDQIKDCLGKLLDIQQNEIREIKRENRKINERELFFLWIITPTISAKVLADFQAQSKDNWEKGVYFLAKGLSTGIVAIHQLPKTRDTLWLRLLGREKIQYPAIKELESLVENDQTKKIILKSIYGLLNAIKANQKKSLKIENETEELIMSLKSLIDRELAEKYAHKDMEYAQKDQQYAQKEQQYAQKEQQYAQKEQQFSQKEQFIKQKEQEFSQKEQFIKQKEQQFSQKEQEILHKNQQLDQLIKQSIRSNIINILEKRFSHIPLDLVTKINLVDDTNKLQYFLLESAAIANVKDFQSLLNQEIS